MLICFCMLAKLTRLLLSSVSFRIASSFSPFAEVAFFVAYILLFEVGEVGTFIFFRRLLLRLRMYFFPSSSP